MKISNLLNKNVKISLVPNVSQFIVDSKFLLVKRDNRLFKISTASDIVKLSIIFDILKEPKRLIDIINILSDFRKKDVIDLLKSLYELNIINIEDIKILLTPVTQLPPFEQGQEFYQDYGNDVKFSAKTARGECAA